MKEKLLSKLGVVLVVLFAFVDGILVAGEFDKKSNTDAAEPLMLEDVFEIHSAEEAPEVEEVEEVEEEPEVKTIPFTSQAPHGDWKEPWSDYAEEAVVYMAIKWVNGEEMGSARERASDLMAIGEWEAERFGNSVDTPIIQVLEILTDYFGHSKARLLYDVTENDLLTILDREHLAILPVNGRLLDSPNYGDPAPKHHNLLLIGYVPETREFIVHDPGTRRGESYHFPFEKILGAIQDIDGANVVIEVED